MQRSLRLGSVGGGFPKFRFVAEQATSPRPSMRIVMFCSFLLLITSHRPGKTRPEHTYAKYGVIWTNFSKISIETLMSRLFCTNQGHLTVHDTQSHPSASRTPSKVLSYMFSLFVRLVVRGHNWHALVTQKGPNKMITHQETGGFFNLLRSWENNLHFDVTGGEAKKRQSKHGILKSSLQCRLFPL